MNTVAIIVGIIVLLVLAGGFVWAAFHHGKVTGLKKAKDSTNDPKDAANKLTKDGHPVLLADAARLSAEEIFNEDFREELKNRGRLHFEKIINENAMFLQQDLRLTTSQINEYMKDEIKKTLTNEFAKYEQSIADAKQLAIDSIEKTTVAIEQQRGIMEEQLRTQVNVEKQRLIERFESNMADIVNHYVLSAIGEEIDLSNQLEFIIGYLEENKKEILDDIQSGA